MALLILLLACLPKAPAPPVPGVTRSELPADLRGLSGLTVDDQGGLWSVAERGVALVPLRLDGDRVVSAGPSIRVEGWPVGVDAESVAWVGPGRFLVGTETLAEGRRADRVYEVLVGETATLGRSWELAYAPFGLLAEENRGVESLDYVDGALIAASETVHVAPTPAPHAADSRCAPVWRAPLDGGEAEHAFIALTSADGKLSSLVATDTGILAIERHYGTVRLVAADLAWGSTTPAAARVVRDLAADLGDLPNLEGLARLADGRVVLLADNQSGFRVDGPTVALVLAAE